MNGYGILDNNWQTKILWCTASAAALFMLAFSLFEAFRMPLSSIGVLIVATFIAVIISRYPVNVPGTPISFSLKTLFAFWGVMWLGLPGGVLIGAAASVASVGFKTRDKRSLAAEAAVDTISTFFSAIAFILAISVFKSETSTVTAPGGFNIPIEVVNAAFAMALTHYAQKSALDYLFYGVARRQRLQAPAKVILFYPAAGYTFTLIATIISYLLFNHFGIEFGLVILPLVIAGEIAYRIHVRSLEHKTKQVTEASRLHLATVEALATAIDARDQVGVGHVRRTQIYAVGIGNILGLSEDEINALRTGALLHDIGKLAVPDHILNKPGKLTPAEMEKTKTHASVGASILEKVGFPYPVVPAVKYHHESWDGSGYPEGLRANNIPLTARILAVADAYDTLRGSRPYRKAVTREEAGSYLRSGAGSRFDPKIVEIFLRNLRIFDEEIDAHGLGYDSEPANLRDPFANTMDGASPSYVEQIKQANREVFTLYALAREFGSALNLKDTLSLFSEKVREFVPFDTCLVYLLDETKEFATAVHADGRHDAVLQGKRVKVGEGATGYVLKKNKPVENVDPSLDFAFTHIEFSREYIAMASIPLMADDKLLGAVSLYSSDLAQYQDEHLRLLETVSRIAADAISKALQHAETETYALTDPMTGLPNARSMQIHFDKEVKRATRSDSTFQVLVLDLDGFKAVNDTHGHKTGDKMLKEISKVIRGQLRDYDFLARYGGDEFVAIVPETQSEDVLELCRRIEESVNAFELPVGDGQITRVGVSVGAASYPTNGETFDQIIIAADKAMYMTKAFHKKRNHRIEEQLHLSRAPESEEERSKPTIVPAPVPVPADAIPVEFEAVDILDANDSLIVELDERHIVSSGAVN